MLLAVGLAVRERLPARFFADSGLIQALARGATPVAADESYTRTAALYRVLGLAQAGELATLLGLAAFSFTMMLAWRSSPASFSVWTTALLGLSALFATLYLTPYNKEITVLPIVLLALRTTSTRRTEALLLLAMASYAILFRDYWFLVLAVYIAYRVTIARYHSVKLYLLAGAAALIAISLAFKVYLGLPLNYFRVTTSAVGIDVNSTIRGPDLGGGVVAQAVEAAAVLAGLLLPWQLVALAAPLYAVAALALVLLWARFAVTTVRVIRGSDRSDAPAERWVALVSAFVTVQAVFEPDYGSYLRHLTPLLPLVVALSVRHPPRIKS